MQNIQTGKTMSIGNLTIHISDKGIVRAAVDNLFELGRNDELPAIERAMGRVTPTFKKQQEANREVIRFFEQVIAELKKAREKAS